MIRTTEVIAAANARLRAVLMEEVGACEGTTLLLELVDRVPSPTVRQLAAERGVPSPTLMSRLFRLGVPGVPVFKHAILLYRLRTLLEERRLTITEAAYSLEASSPPALTRTVRMLTGQTLREWREVATPAQPLSAWVALLKEHRTGIRRIRLAARGMSRLEMVTQLQLEVRRRELALSEARLRLKRCEHSDLAARSA